MLTPASTIAIVGFGAQAAQLAAVLAPRGCALRAFDLRLRDIALGPATRLRIESAGVDAMNDLAAALRGARLVVFDAAPPDQVVAALLVQGQLVLDLHPGGDAQPGLVRAQGAHYLCGACETVAGATVSQRLLIAGDHAAACAEALRGLGLPTEVAEWSSPPARPTADTADAGADAGDRPAPRPTVHRGELP